MNFYDLGYDEGFVNLDLVTSFEKKDTGKILFRLAGGTEIIINYCGRDTRNDAYVRLIERVGG